MFCELVRTRLAMDLCRLQEKNARLQDQVRAIRAELGHPTILINNAGMIVFRPLMEESPAQLDKMVAVNLTSHWNTLRAFLPNMIANDKGHVLATASMASYVTVASTTGYAATKAAVLTLYEGESPFRCMTSQPHRLPKADCGYCHF